MRIREPVNGLSHLLGLVLAAAGTLFLLGAAQRPEQLAAFSIYGSTLILLYAASTLYHSLPLPDRPLRALRTADHIAIYFLIAGTYTPIALLTLNSRLGWTLLAVVWLIAAAGIPFKLYFLDAPVWLSTATYLVMGYLALVAVIPLVRAVSVSGVLWLVAGGFAYTVGAVIYSRQRPNPFPGRFGHHEIWHVLVLVGSACHFAFMVYYVV
ncbi:MAG TPA: hemolysin III family protein [Gemmatimonadales bacterium]|nr:hemolysin III family protein [Gemmatimonadales bacterium]